MVQYYSTPHALDKSTKRYSTVQWQMVHGEGALSNYYTVLRRVNRHLEGFHNEFPNVDPRTLVVVDGVSHVAVHPTEQVEHRKELQRRFQPHRQ